MTHLRILHAEDEPSIIDTVSTMLNAHAPALKFELEIASVRKFEDFKAIAFDGWDAILLDLSFPDGDADNTLAWLKDNFTKLGAVLVITGNSRDAVYYQSLTSGALRALLKPDFRSKDEAEVKPVHLLLRIYESVLVNRTYKEAYGTTQTQ